MASDSTDLENYYATSSSVLHWRRCLTCWQAWFCIHPHRRPRNSVVSIIQGSAKIDQPHDSENFKRIVRQAKILSVSLLICLETAPNLHNLRPASARIFDRTKCQQPDFRRHHSDLLSEHPLTSDSGSWIGMTNMYSKSCRAHAGRATGSYESSCLKISEFCGRMAANSPRIKVVQSQEH